MKKDKIETLYICDSHKICGNDRCIHSKEHPDENNSCSKTGCTHSKTSKCIKIDGWDN